MTSATDELRRLLDERGVEWMPSAFDPPHETFYKVNGVGFIVTEFPEIQRMSLACDMRITPKQAVAATLGQGTCHVESMHGYTDPFVATRYSVELSCHTLEDWPDREPPEFCPWCGAKVVEE